MQFWQCPLKSDPYQRHLIFLTDTIERGANAVGMSIPPPGTTESGDRSPIKYFSPEMSLLCYGEVL